MLWVLQFLLRYRNVTALAVTVLLSMLMITSGTSAQERTARWLSVTVFYPLQFVMSQVTRVRNAFAENRQLRAQAAAMNVRMAQLEEAAAENRRLRDLLQFDSLSTLDLLPARVIARDPSPLYRSIVISAGANRLIGPYMPVVNNLGVVGKVVQVLPAMSVVQLVRDPAARVSVLLQRSREVGILETASGEDFFVHCRLHADVEAGDIVVTSGLGGIFPKGLYVGDVLAVQREKDPLFKKVVVKVSVDFQRLEEVFVIRREPQWASLERLSDSLGAAQ